MKIFKLTIALLLMSMYQQTILAQSISTPPKKEVVSSAIKTIDLAVDGMTCQKGCADGIDRKFKSVNGIIKSKTKLSTGISSVTYDESKIKVSEIIHIIEKRGYTVKVAQKSKKV